jgi:hypothetical protein
MIMERRINWLELNVKSQPAVSFINNVFASVIFLKSDLEKKNHVDHWLFNQTRLVFEVFIH